MNNGTTETTNGKKAKSKLQRLLDSREGQKVSEADKKKAGEAFKAARVAQDKAEKVYLDAKAKAVAAAEAMVLAYGNIKINIGEDQFEPTCRGESVFYQKVTNTGSADI